MKWMWQKILNYHAFRNCTIGVTQAFNQSDLFKLDHFIHETESSIIKKIKLKKIMNCLLKVMYTHIYWSDTYTIGKTWGKTSLASARYSYRIPDSGSLRLRTNVAYKQKINKGLWAILEAEHDHFLFSIFTGWVNWSLQG